MDIRHDQKLISMTKHTELMLQCPHHLRLSYKHTTTGNEINPISYKSVMDDSSLPMDHLWDSSQLQHVSYGITPYPYNSATVIIQKLLYKHWDTLILRYAKNTFQKLLSKIVHYQFLTWPSEGLRLAPHRCSLKVFLFFAGSLLFTLHGRLRVWTIGLLKILSIIKLLSYHCSTMKSTEV